MPLVIKTTGIEDYVTGDGRIKMLVIGGPATGKTRMASFWPRPIYADTEGGRGSIADRNVPYAEIKTSQDMLDFLAYLKAFESQDRSKRPYDTVVIDTLDGFQRKVIDERLQQTKKQAFSGFEDWGYLDSKVQMLLTRLLNLDLNVLVNVHYKDKIVGTGDDATREITFQLKGSIQDSLANDFDLIGRLGTYWAAEGGERVEKRGLTFKKTPDWPLLKDRYGVMPGWTEISLTSEQDYQFIRDAFKARLDSLTAGEVVGEIPTAEPATTVAAPSSGPLPAVDPKNIPLSQFDKATLVKMCRDEGVTTLVDGTLIKGNTVKAEIVQALEAHRAAKAAAEAVKPAESDAASASPSAPDVVPEANVQPASTPADVAVPTPSEVAAAIPQQRTEEDSVAAATAAVSTSVEAASAQVDEPAALASTPELAPEPTVDVQVDTTTGEIAPEEPVGPVVEAPVAEVPSQSAPADTTSVPAPTPALAAAKAVCEVEGCDVDLTTQKQDYIRLGFIKWRRRLCNGHYVAAKDNGVTTLRFTA